MAGAEGFYQAVEFKPASHRLMRNGCVVEAKFSSQKGSAGFQEPFTLTRLDNSETVRCKR